MFEGTPRLGGRAQTRTVDGFCLNQGPHALYVAGAFCNALHAFGVSFSGSGPDLPGGMALWGETAKPFPVRGAGAVAESLTQTDAATLAAFFDGVAAGSDFEPGSSLQDVLSDLPTRARNVVEALIRLSTYVHAPAAFDASAALNQLRLSFSGTVYVDGGWQTLVDGLAASALLAGATIRTGERVVSVRSTDRTCYLELREGRTEEFTAVILAVPPKSTASLVATSSELATTANALQPVRVATLDIGLSAQMHGKANFALGMDQPTYFSVHSAVSKLAPAGGSLMHLARYLEPGEQPTLEHFEAVREIADAMQPGWRDHVGYEQRLSGAIVAHDIPRAENRGRRTASVIPDTRGVFLAGDWVGGEGLLADAAAASARSAAAAAVKFVKELRADLS